MQRATGARRRSAGKPLRPVIGRITRTMAGLAVTACFLAAVALILVPALGRSLDHRTVVITTGSMTPTIHPGDAIVLEEVSSDDVRVGDAITYGTPSESGLVTHRVLAVRNIDGMIWFQTKGDANENPDPDLTPAAAVEGRVRWTVPRVGTYMVEALSPWGTLILLGIPASVLFLQEAMALRSTWRRSPKGPAERWTEPAAAG